jgi:hypothetical protein
LGIRGVDRNGAIVVRNSVIKTAVLGERPGPVVGGGPRRHDIGGDWAVACDGSMIDAMREKARRATLTSWPACRLKVVAPRRAF